MIKNILLFFFLILSNFILFAQAEKNVDHQSLVWTRYYNLLELDKKWSIHSEFDNRIFIEPIAQNLFVARVQGKYKITDSVELGSGFAYFSVATQNPDVDSGFNKPEYRALQDITLKRSLGKINLNHRCQTEERFFRNFDSQGLKGGTTFALRFRYRIQGDYVLWKNVKQSLKAVLADEIMFNAGSEVIKNKFDQNRIYVALQYCINKIFAIEAGYLNSYQQRVSGVDYYNRDIFRITFYHKIKLHS
ncbi:DUF2490 domain-containing protein [Flavobacterium psychrotolerans]|uniref:DUF2490 domain-containing protein n=1 Tax=Flavobacterium psychrotolerans TaxID=2169410 RepID=A0A2U1JN67_9FLAO|nr:DUF2490 domain-containing protein [Flavobacterium psychrotolerans]PWA06445.1 DUF2490 domain-containing protein [Flavobacterium psychrotolerans]